MKVQGFVEQKSVLANTWVRQVRPADPIGFSFLIPQEISGDACLKEMERLLTGKSWAFEISTSDYRPEQKYLILFPLGHP